MSETTGAAGIAEEVSPDDCWALFSATSGRLFTGMLVVLALPTKERAEKYAANFEPRPVVRRVKVVPVDE
jgi:hypothetical protein